MWAWHQGGTTLAALFWWQAFACNRKILESVFIDPQAGKLHIGLCAQEYVHHVLPKLIADGNVLFGVNGKWSSEWKLQQNNAPCHTAKITKQALAQLLPNRAITDWPPNSPDLSPIENLWAWAEKKLQASVESMSTVADLRRALMKTLKHARKEMLQNLMRSIEKRVHEVTVIAKQGGPVGKVND